MAIIRNHRVVVCAAIMNRAGDIICGARHYDTVMHQQLQNRKEMPDNARAKDAQGFIDQYGVFMDRHEALKVATDAGQINQRRRKTNPVDRLFSEDLY